MKNVDIKIDKAQFANIKKQLDRFPKDFMKDEVMMAVFRKASKPLLSAGENLANARIPNVAKGTANTEGFVWSARKDKSGEIMRVGVVNKRGTTGSLGHIFNDGTKNRVTASGHKTGRIDPTKFWDDAVKSSERDVHDAVVLNFDKVSDRFARRYKI